MNSQMGGRAAGKGKDRFLDPNNVSMLSIPKQTKIYVDRLRNESQHRQSSIFDYGELVRIGKEINL